MKQKYFFALWGVLLALCAGLGFLPEPTGAVRWLLTVLALASFVPPLILVHRAARKGDRETLTLIRNLAVGSLALTIAALIANFLSFSASETLGNLLYYVLIVVSSPMICSGHWALSLFLWAYLMIACISALKKK